MEQLIDFSKNLCITVQQQQSQFEQQCKATQKQFELLNLQYHHHKQQNIEQQQLKQQLNLKEPV